MSVDPSKIRALLFDLDGTLIDSREDIAASANALRSSLGLAPLPVELVGSYVGDGIEALVRKVQGPEHEAELPSSVEKFRSHYHEHCVERTYLYDGVKPTLKVLAGRGYKMAVVTNKPERISVRILELLGLADYFGCVIGGNGCENKKPHPQPLEEACRRLGVELARACMIGDSRVDIEAGKNAGIPSLGLLGGIGDEALMRAAGPSQVLEKFAELDALFWREPMKTGAEGKPAKEFQIKWTDRIYRLHLTGIGNHAPRGAGVYEIVLFPPGAEDGEVIYAGFEPEGGSVAATLQAIFENKGGLPVDKLAVVQENIANAYFDAVSVANVESDDDLLDLAWAVVQVKKPRLNNPLEQRDSGRFSEISYNEL